MFLEMQAKGKKAKKDATVGETLATIGKGIVSFVFLIIGYFLVFLKFARVLSHSEAPTILKGTCGVKKNVAWSSDFTVSDGKLIGQSANQKVASTLNDVVLAAIAGGSRRYIESKDASFGERERVDITCAIPVNLRAAGEEVKDLGNKFGFLTCELPLYKMEGLGRVKEVGRRMSVAKKLPEANFGFLMGKVAGLLPTTVLKQAFDVAGAKATLAISNVKGPDKAVHFFKKEVKDMAGFLPPPPGIAIGFAIASYGNNLTISVNCDNAVCPDAEELLGFVKSEWDSMLGTAKSVSEEMRAPISPKTADKKNL